MFLEPVMGLRSFFVPFRFLPATALLTLASCSAWKSKRVHAAAVVLIVLLVVIGIRLNRFHLGQFMLR